MAVQEEISRTYDYMDELFRLAFGPHPDITCALFDGDFSKTLEEAQAAKHDFVLDGLNLRSGERLLDIGCGWGPLLDAYRRRGGEAIGITLSARQAEACRRAGLDVHLLDWRDVTPSTFGSFDAVACIGAFEHFCSEDEYVTGQQDAVYRRFFELCHALLRTGGRLYLQTMLWGKNAPRYGDISLQAPRGSAEYMLAVLRKFYPGSFPPFGEEQIRRCAATWFTITSMRNGRLDYIQTMRKWGRVWKVTPRSALTMLRTLRFAFIDRDFVYKLESLFGSYNTKGFEREFLDHQRIFFGRR